MVRPRTGLRVSGAAGHRPGRGGEARLALELARQLKDEGWEWQLTGDGHESEAVRTAASLGQRVLLIVDYAESRTGLSAMLTELARTRSRDGSTVLRVLLLARSRGEWWDQLLASGWPVRALAEVVPDFELPPELSPGVDPLQVMREAAGFFAGRLGKPEPSEDLTLPADLRPPVLVLHAAALVRVLDGDDGLAGPRAMDARGVLRHLLGHERELWRGRRTASA